MDYNYYSSRSKNCFQHGEPTSSENQKYNRLPWLVPVPQIPEPWLFYINLETLMKQFNPRCLLHWCLGQGPDLYEYGDHERKLLVFHHEQPHVSWASLLILQNIPLNLRFAVGEPEVPSEVWLPCTPCRWTFSLLSSMFLSLSISLPFQFSRFSCIGSLTLSDVSPQNLLPRHVSLFLFFQSGHWFSSMGSSSSLTWSSPFFSSSHHDCYLLSICYLSRIFLNPLHILPPLILILSGMHVA